MRDGPRVTWKTETAGWRGLEGAARRLVEMRGVGRLVAWSQGRRTTPVWPPLGGTPAWPPLGGTPAYGVARRRAGPPRLALALTLAVGLVLATGALGREVWRGVDERAALLVRTAVMARATQARSQILTVQLASVTATVAGQADELAALEALLRRQTQGAVTLERALAEARAQHDDLDRAYHAARLAAEARARLADDRSSLQREELARLGTEIEQRDSELARLSQEVEALGAKVAETEALTKRVRQTLGLPTPTGPAGGDEPLPTTNGEAGEGRSELVARLDALRARAASAGRDLAEADRLLRQRVYALRQLTAAGQPMRLGAATLALAPTGRPVGGAITSGYGMRVSPIDNELRFHGGVDFGASYGTPVRATREGEVTLVGQHRGYGLTVVIRHAGGFETLFGHLSQVAVRSGQRVERGEVIGRSGNSGVSSGPHLHYEVLYQGRQIDPAPLLTLP